MSTSLQQLLDQLAVHADTAEGPRAVTDAADALYHLGRALTQLSVDGLDLTHGGPREQPAHALAAACREVCPAAAGGGRLGDLAGAAADLAALWSPTTPRDDRWAAATQVGRTADHCAQLIGRERPYNTVISGVERSAAELALAAGLDPPHRRHNSVLDRPVLASDPTSGPPAVQLAAQAIRHLEAAVAQATAAPDGGTQPLTVTEWQFAVLAAETATRHILALRGSDPAAEPMHPAAQAWCKARAATAPFRDGILHRRDHPPDTITWAILTHKALTAELGPLTRAGHPPHEQRDGWVVLQMQIVASTLPRLTGHLHATAEQWAQHGLVRADARDLIRGRDDRVTAVLQGQTVTVHATDLRPTLAALRTAGKLTADLAADVNLAPPETRPLAGAYTAAADRPILRPDNTPRPPQQPRHGPDI